MWDETVNVYRVPTHSTPLTPEKQPSRSREAAPAPQLAPELPLQEFDGWAEDFGRWALAHCLFRDRCWGGMAALHWRFVDWCAECDLPGGGPHLPAFAALLEAEGFALTECSPLAEHGMVYGLLLGEDWEAAQPAAPPATPAEAPGETAARKLERRGDLLRSR